MSNAFIDNQFHRWNTNIDKNSSHHDDTDRHTLYENENFQRMDMHKAAAKEVEGNTQVVPVDDNDAVFHFFDNQGESMYTNPPDPNQPLIDHTLDQEHVWAFRMTGYNQDVVFNEYARDAWNAAKLTHAPWWGQKLATPAFYTDEKYQEFFHQWGQRLGLELIKIRQATEFQPGNQQQYEQFKAEISSYIGKVEQDNIEKKFKDVYITDHRRKEEKLLTHSADEDLAFFNYKQALQNYK